VAHLNHTRSGKFPRGSNSGTSLLESSRVHQSVRSGGLALAGLTAFNPLGSTANARDSAAHSHGQHRTGTGVPPLAGTPTAVPRNAKYTLDRPCQMRQCHAVQQLLRIHDRQKRVWEMVGTFPDPPWR